MGKRGFEGRWLEFCEAEPVEVVKAMIRLGQGVLKRRVRKHRDEFKADVVPATLLKEPPPEAQELFERDAKGEPLPPF